MIEVKLPFCKAVNSLLK